MKKADTTENQNVIKVSAPTHSIIRTESQVFINLSRLLSFMFFSFLYMIRMLIILREKNDKILQQLAEFQKGIQWYIDENEGGHALKELNIYFLNKL